jgi:hypothetical protein
MRAAVRGQRGEIYKKIFFGMSAREILERAREAKLALVNASEEMKTVERELLVAFLSSFATRQALGQTTEREVEVVRNVLSVVATMTKAANNGISKEKIHVSPSFPEYREILSQVYDYSGTSAFDFELAFAKNKE